jgi:hypothetical protein
MKPTDFIKDKASVMKTLIENADGTVVTKTGCRIFIPKRFIERGMAEVGSENYSIGLFPLVTPDNRFMLFNAIAYIYLNPSEFSTVFINGEEFIDFKFEPNTIVIKSLNLVQKDTLVYSVFNEFISNGNVPWYVNYDDSGTTFDTATTIAGTSIGQNPEQIEILLAAIARQPQDRMKYFRTLLQKPDDAKKLTPAFVPLKSVSYSATNTTNKLAGAYFDEGVRSALLNPTKTPDTIGTMLRR